MLACMYQDIEYLTTAHRTSAHPAPDIGHTSYGQPEGQQECLHEVW